MRGRMELSSVRTILTQLAHTIPAETARHAAAWTKDYPGYVLEVVAELPEDSGAPAMALAIEVIRRHDDNANLVESIIAAVARFHTREALDLAIKMKGRGELINGLIIAMTRLHGTFPEECEAVARELCSRPDLGADTLSYASNFYAVASERSPEVAIEFLRRTAELEIPDAAGSISRHMIKLAKSGNSKFHVLIEERLRIEENPTSLLNYAIAVSEYRKLRADDLDWLKAMDWISDFSRYRFRAGAVGDVRYLLSRDHGHCLSHGKGVGIAGVCKTEFPASRVSSGGH